MSKPLAGKYTSSGWQGEKLGYRAAKIARESGRPAASGGSGDSHLRHDRDVLVRQSQEFYRDNGLYEGIVNRACDNILGDGFSLQARTDDPATNTAAEKLWREYWLQPEARGMDSGYDIERLVLKHLWVDGDIGCIKTNLQLIQLIESERITSNRTSLFERRIEDGVELSGVGRPIGFHVADYDAAGQVQRSKTERYKAEDFLFLSNRQRISQTRGVPVMVSNFPMFHRVNDICDSEAVAWQLLARMAIAISRPNAEQKAFARSDTDPNTKTSPPDISDRIQDFDYGMIFHAEPGDEIKGIERNVPGSNFTASLTMFIRLLGLPVGFPLELILLDWSQTNYSSARAALEQAFRMFACWQRRLKMNFHAPVYTWKIQQWVAEGRLPNRADIAAHEWITPSFPWIDQLKEAKAWGERLDRGMASLSQAVKSLNQDREEWLKQREREVQDAISVADGLNKKNPGANVDWRMFAGVIARTADSVPRPEDDGGSDAKAA